MPANPFDQFDAPTAAANPFDQFDRPATPLPVARRTYTAAEVPGAFVSNIPASAKRFGTELYEAVTHPIETVKGVWDVAAGALQKVLPEDAVKFISQFDANPAAATKAIEAANAFGGVYKERYGSYENFKRTLAEDPVGAAADISALFSGGAAAMSKSPSVSKALTTAARVTNPLSVVTEPVQAVIAAKQTILPSALLKEREANAVRDATLRAAQKEGYVATPGSVSPTGRNIISERIAGKTHLEQLASIQNQVVTDRLSRRALGLSETAPLTTDNMRLIRKQEYAKGYEPIEKIGPVKTDSAFLDDLANIEDKYISPAASFPGAAPEPVAKLLQSFLVGEFDSKHALQMSAILRTDAKGNFRKGDTTLAKAQIALSNALENQLERFLASKGKDSANALEQFRLSRQRMAVSHTIEDAIREGGGSVIGAKLARDIQSGKYVSGDVKTIADFANVFPRVTQTPSQIGAPATSTLLGRGMTGLAGGGLAFLANADPYTAAAALAAGTVAPEVLSASLRNYLLSGRAQSRLIPSYESLPSRLTSPEAARNALIMQQLGQERQRQNALAP